MPYPLALHKIARSPNDDSRRGDYYFLMLIPERDPFFKQSRVRWLKQAKCQTSEPWCDRTFTTRCYGEASIVRCDCLIAHA